MIRIARLTDYALVLLARLALEGPDALLSARTLAEDTTLPLPTVGKILKTLTREGLLRSRRGAQGGYGLARPVDEISVAEFIAAVEGPIALTECAPDSDGACDLERTCLLRINWQRVSGAVREALEGIPLAQMLPHVPLPAPAGGVLP